MIIALRCLTAIAIFSLAPLTFAHKLAPSLFEMTETSVGTFDVRWKTPRTLPTPEPIQVSLPAHCEDGSERRPNLDATGILFEWQTMCGDAGLVGQTIRFTGLGINQSAAVIKIDLLDGRSYRQLLNGEQNEFLVPPRMAWGAVALDYTALGVEHILGGIDHLFFVWALVLMLATRKLLIAITAFTLGHSLTLSLAALSLIRVPQELTEFFIALSIFVLAVEAARHRFNPEDHSAAKGLVARHSFWICALFGLLHGLGFAGALREIGLPQEEVLTALLMFNIGVEIGQILFIGVVLGIGATMRTVAKQQFPVMTPDRWIWMPIYLIGSGSTYWCIDRSLGLIG